LPEPAQQGFEAVLSSFAPLCPGSDQDRHKLLRAWLRDEGAAGLVHHRLLAQGQRSRGSLGWLEHPWLRANSLTIKPIFKALTHHIVDESFFVLSWMSKRFFCAKYEVIVPITQNHSLFQALA
jgi:hypothetical protein